MKTNTEHYGATDTLLGVSPATRQALAELDEALARAREAAEADEAARREEATARLAAIDDAQRERLLQSLPAEAWAAIEKRLEALMGDYFHRLTLREKEVLTMAEGAEVTGFSKAHLYRLTAEGEVPHYKRGGRVYFRYTELLDWLTAHRVKTREEIDREAARYCYTNRLTDKAL